MRAGKVSTAFASSRAMPIGVAGVGSPVIIVDPNDGAIIGERIPWKGTVADIFIQAQFPLHSGRILGLPGRISHLSMKLVVAALSVTGVVIWYRKARARRAVRRSRGGRPSFLPPPRAEGRQPIIGPGRFGFFAFLLFWQGQA